MESAQQPSPQSFFLMSAQGGISDQIQMGQIPSQNPQSSLVTWAAPSLPVAAASQADDLQDATRTHT